jgi:hypothetical protein
LNSLKKYLCALEPNITDQDKPSPSTDDGVRKPPNRPNSEETNKKTSR